MRVQVGELAADIWPFGAIGLAILFIVLLVIFWRRKHSLSYLLCFSIFSLYLLLAMDKTFFPMMISGNYADAMKQVPFMANVNLIPFYFGPYGTLESSLITLLQNVVLTIPFGFGVNFLAHVRVRRVIWLALAVGLSIEGTQLVISLILGYAYRIIDINDVLMNALGVLIGYGIFRAFAWMCVWATPRFNIQYRGFATYIYEIAKLSKDRGAVKCVKML